MENTGKAVAQLTMAWMEARRDPPSPTSSDVTVDQPFYQNTTKVEKGSHVPRFGFNSDRPRKEEKFHAKVILHKMSFPQFTGKQNPCIWKDKCKDYFKIFDIPKSMWASYASLNMDDNAAKWLQMYKKKYGLEDWDTFIQAVEAKFGDNDYRTVLTQLLELQQQDSLETYILSFEDLQYQVTMYNSELGDLFFVTQFIKGLKLEIGSVVQSQVPETLERAILLARIQQQVLDRSKTKWALMLILLDSGSSHCFVSSTFLSAVGIIALPTNPMQVKLANGDILITDHWVPQFSWWANGHTLKKDMRVLPLGAYDAILGFDWLKTHSPMQCHWAERTIQFMDEGKDLQELPVHQLLKRSQGNDVWALAVVEAVPDSQQQRGSEEIQQVL
ncbi:uncharacterized protein [Setaria viridis]|uniref:uncharacterized protein n=1 Tax=Setaria viridis TaxID=4556 RepID=UPI003B3A5F89